MNEDTELLEGLLASLGPMASMAFGMLDKKNPELAKRLRARYDRYLQYAKK